MEAAQASTSMSGSLRGSSALQNVNHIAHLSGALIGAALVWLLSRVPTDPPDPTSKTKDLQWWSAKSSFAYIDYTTEQDTVTILSICSTAKPQKLFKYILSYTCTVPIL